MAASHGGDGRKSVSPKSRTRWNPENNAMIPITTFEKFAFPIILAASAVGYGASWIMTSDAFAEHWISREDGLLEMGTFFVLMASAALCLYRGWALRNERSKGFVSMLVFAAVVLIFGAGEEISWGQRMFGIETPEFFRTHNVQNETNLHNLVVAGVGVNKLVFGKLLAIGLVCYLIPLGLLYRRSHWCRTTLNRFAIPVPRVYHAIAILAIVAIVETSPARKRGEINEFAISSIVFLILFNPTNRHIFLPAGRSESRTPANRASASTFALNGSSDSEIKIRRAA